MPTHHTPPNSRVGGLRLQRRPAPLEAGLSPAGRGVADPLHRRHRPVLVTGRQPRQWSARHRRHPAELTSVGHVSTGRYRRNHAEPTSVGHVSGGNMLVLGVRMGHHSRGVSARCQPEGVSAGVSPWGVSEVTGHVPAVRWTTYRCHTTYDHGRQHMTDRKPATQPGDVQGGNGVVILSGVYASHREITTDTSQRVNTTAKL